jgi:hypothetical protein
MDFPDLLNALRKKCKKNFFFTFDFFNRRNFENRFKKCCQFVAGVQGLKRTIKEVQNSWPFSQRIELMDPVGRVTEPIGLGRTDLILVIGLINGTIL